MPAEVLRERFDVWFPFGRHLIEGLYHTARSIESTARQRASLVTLGTLSAGLAHEINNPAAAAAADTACDLIPFAAAEARRLFNAALQRAMIFDAREQYAPREIPAYQW